MDHKISRSVTISVYKMLIKKISKVQRRLKLCSFGRTYAFGWTLLSRLMSPCYCSFFQLCFSLLTCRTAEMVDLFKALNYSRGGNYQYKLSTGYTDSHCVPADVTILNGP